MLEQYAGEATLLLFGFFAGWGFRGVVFSIIDGMQAEQFRRAKLRHDELRRQREERAEGAA